MDICLLICYLYIATLFYYIYKYAISYTTALIIKLYSVTTATEDGSHEEQLISAERDPSYQKSVHANTHMHATYFKFFITYAKENLFFTIGLECNSNVSFAIEQKYLWRLLFHYKSFPFTIFHYIPPPLLLPPLFPPLLPPTPILSTAR